MLALPPRPSAAPTFLCRRPCAALLLGLGLLFLLMLCPRPARAQYSAVASYTGGTATSGTTTRPYTYDYPGGIYVYGGGLSASAGSGDTASCTGGITAAFTWVSSTLPPSSVIIEQSTEAWARGSTVNDVYTPPASCSVNNPYSSPGSSSSPGTLLGKQYSAKSNPGASFSVTCSGLSSSATPQASSDGSFVSTSVSYAAAAFPVTINPGGATSDGSGGWDILVGQECTAGLAGIPSDCTVSDYQWSVSGTTFQSWSADTPAIGNAPYNQDASYYVDGPGPLSNPTASWYWNDLNQTSETVNCTATVTPPAGQGSPFPITVTQKVTVMVPNWKATGTGGNMQVLGTLSGDYFLQASPLPGSGKTGGMEWEASVSSPDLGLFGDGNLELVQLIIPNASYTSHGFFHNTYTWSLNGQEGLDTPYPYPGSTGATFTGTDSPSLALTSLNAQSATLTDQFEDYLMYFAPGSVQPVPLGRFIWSTNGNATLPSSGTWAGYGSAGSVTPSGSATKFLPSNMFPMWTQNSGNDAGGHF